MNKIQKLLLALLVLGSIPGGLWAMDVSLDDAQRALMVDPDTEDTEFDFAPETEEERLGDIVPTVVTSVADVPQPPVAVVTTPGDQETTAQVTTAVTSATTPVNPATQPQSAADNPDTLTLLTLGVDHSPQAPVIDTTAPGTPIVINIDPAAQPHTSTPAFTENLFEKIQPLMTKQGLLGLSGLILAITGLRYVYVSSVLKQIADLQSLSARCDMVLKAVLQGHVDAELVELDTVFCCGLDQELQDKLDDALSSYNIALQQVCHELCTHRGDTITNSMQVQQARKALAVCQQVIDECKQVLVKKPTIADSMLKKGSIWAQALTTQVKSATTAITHRFKRQGPKMA
jgi:hypothetical protein